MLDQKEIVKKKKMSSVCCFFGADKVEKKAFYSTISIVINQDNEIVNRIEMKIKTRERNSEKLLKVA